MQLQESGLSFGCLLLLVAFGVYRGETTAGSLLSMQAPDSQSAELSVVIFHRLNSCWQPRCVILFT